MGNTAALGHDVGVIGMLFSLVGSAISLFVQLLMLTFQLVVWMLKLTFELLFLFLDELNRSQRK